MKPETDEEMQKELLEECGYMRKKIEKIKDPKKGEKVLMCLNRLQQIIVL